MRVRDGLSEAAQRLRDGGLGAARHEARLLLAAALDCEPGDLLGGADGAIDEPARQRFAQFIDRRLAREPVSRIRGHREFWSLRFEITRDTLDPRPDSETLIEAILERLPDRQAPFRLLDLGTGSGCLLLALLTELPQAMGLGVDCLPGAVATARRNAAALGLAARARVELGCWGAELAPGYDIILANPPYIPSGAIAELMPEVARYEPRTALDGGVDGLAAFRALAPELHRLLTPAGIAAVELGAGQLESVTALMVGAGLAIRGVQHDLSGTARCLVLGSV
jgi:release factor glutamine methyltransferase